MHVCTLARVGAGVGGAIATNPLAVIFVSNSVHAIVHACAQVCKLMGANSMAPLICVVCPPSPLRTMPEDQEWLFLELTAHPLSAMP
jgi:hypothetical protein